MRERWRQVAIVLTCALVLASCAAPAGEGPPPTTVRQPDLVRLTFLQVNDHYSLEPVDGGRRGGMARLATLVKRIKRESPNTLFALAGDAISPSVMSTYLQGQQMIAGLNLAGLDLATFGNHEFDFGAAVLLHRMQESKFLWLSANVLDRRTGLPLGGARADRLITMAGIPVGLFGLTMGETTVTSSPGPDVLIRDPLQAGKDVAAALRQRGARVVVAVTHQDMAQDKALAASADIDLILGGHEHDPLIAEEGRTLITKAGSDARYLMQVDLWLTPEGDLVERSWTFHEVSRKVPPDPEVEALVRAYAQRLDLELDVVVGQTAVPLEARRGQLRTRETNLGNFVTDLMRERMGADVALMNGGGIRTDRTFTPGPITKRDVHSLFPFTNVVMKIETRGTDLRGALEHSLSEADREGGGFLQISGLRLTYDPRRPAGRRLLQVAVGGKPLQEDAAYTVAVIGYPVRGGDGFTAFRAGKVLVGGESGPQLSDLVLEGIATRRTIAPQVEGRIRPVQD